MSVKTHCRSLSVPGGRAYSGEAGHQIFVTQSSCMFHSVVSVRGAPIVQEKDSVPDVIFSCVLHVEVAIPCIMCQQRSLLYVMHEDENVSGWQMSRPETFIPIRLVYSFSLRPLCLGVAMSLPRLIHNQTTPGGTKHELGLPRDLVPSSTDSHT